MVIQFFCADLPSFPYPLVTGLQGCTVQVDDNDLMVSCQFDSSVLLGYSVMVQFAGSFTLLTSETRDDSAVEFEGLIYGVHNVIVLPLMENGITGTSVAYTEQITVTLPTTSAPPTTVTTTRAPPTAGTAATTTSGSRKEIAHFVHNILFTSDVIYIFFLMP